VPTTFRRSLCAAALVTLASLAHPTFASAGRLGIFGNQLVYTADAGDVLDVAIAFNSPFFTVTELSGETITVVTPGCLLAANSATCSGAGITSLLVVGGAGNDSIVVQASVTIPAFLAGNAGNDHIEGGSGPDTITGGSGNDELSGNAGNDRIFTGPGTDTADGGPGSDVIDIGGSPGPEPVIPSLTLQPPTGVAASVTGSLVTVRWNADLAALSYRLAAGSAPGSSNVFNGNIGNTTTLVATAPNGTYFVRVHSVGTNGESGPSSEVVVAVGPGACTSAPVVPTLQVPGVTGGTVVLNWSASAATTTYIVEAGSQTGLANLANQATGNANTAFTAVTVPRGTYFVRVRARNACGTSGPSNERVVVVP
jgi:hypothetical protein